MQALDMHQEARFQTPGCSKVFQSGLGNMSYPKMYFWKEGTFRTDQNKMLIRGGGVKFRRASGSYSKREELMQGPTQELHMHNANYG